MMQGTEYELFVKQIFEMLLGVDLPECKVEHNVILKGHGGIEHQIDVYWEFKVGGIVYRTAVECKGYNTRVKKEKIAAFHGVLDDIGGIKGIYVTRVGYQSGAMEYAKQHDIQIMVIRHPEDEDWRDRIKEVHIELHYLGVRDVKSEIYVDSKRLLKPMESDIELPIEDGREALLSYDSMEPEEKADNIQDLVNLLPRDEESKERHYSFRFENGLLEYKDNRLPITKISFDYITTSSKMDLVSKANPDLLVYIRDVLQGNEELRTIEKGEIFNGILQD